MWGREVRKGERGGTVVDYNGDVGVVSVGGVEGGGFGGGGGVGGSVADGVELWGRFRGRETRGAGGGGHCGGGIGRGRGRGEGGLGGGSVHGRGSGEGVVCLFHSFPLSLLFTWSALWIVRLKHRDSFCCTTDNDPCTSSRHIQAHSRQNRTGPR